MKEKKTIILVVVLVAMIGVYVWHSQRVRAPEKLTAGATAVTKPNPSTVLMRKVVRGINKYRKEKGSVPRNLDELKGKYLDVATYNQMKKSKLEYAYVNPKAYRLTKPTPTATPVVVAAKSPAAAASSESTSGKQKTKRTGWKYDPTGKPDPFKPFILASRPQEEVTVKVVRQLTPLQKMPLSEIQSGLKAIIWGQLGNKALWKMQPARDT